MNERPALILLPHARHRRLGERHHQSAQKQRLPQHQVLVLVAGPRPEGVKAVNEAHPDVTIYSAALDSHWMNTAISFPASAMPATKRSSAPADCAR